MPFVHSCSEMHAHGNMGLLGRIGRVRRAKKSRRAGRVARGVWRVSLMYWVIYIII